MSSRVIRRQDAGRTVAQVLRDQFHLDWTKVRRLIRARAVWLAGQVCADLSRRVRAGQRLEIRASSPASRPKPAGKSSRPRGLAPSQQSGKKFAKPADESSSPRGLPSRHGIRLRHVDAHIVVVDKPAGLTTVRHAAEAAEFGDRGRKFLPSTLVDLLPELLPNQQGRLRAVHRLDKETSGLVVLARTAAAERHLGRQFRGHTIERRYLAVVRGQAKEERIESRLVRDRGDGRRGSSSPPGVGQRAVTHVRVVESLGRFTLVECRLETGRTHQVRIHLGERGTPLCGDRVYDRPVHGAPVPDASGFHRPALHAAYLAFDHPATGRRLEWTALLPKDMNALFKRMRRINVASGGQPSGGI